MRHTKETLVNRIKELAEAIREAHGALDDHLGDIDLDHFETDDEMRTEAPDLWAAKRLAMTGVLGAR